MILTILIGSCTIYRFTKEDCELHIHLSFFLQDVPTVRLCLRKPRSSKKVQWTQGTVDNEHMNKKKSKCCCIYEKPRSFGESSSEDSDDECEHCHGHKDVHKKILKLDAGASKEEITPPVSESIANAST